MFLLAFLIAFFLVSFVEVLRSSLISSGAPEIPAASAIEGITPGSFSDLAERVKPAVVNISTTKTFKRRAAQILLADHLLTINSVTIFLNGFLAIFLSMILSRKVWDPVLSSAMMGIFLPIIM